VSAHQDQQAIAETRAPALVVSLERVMPSTLPVGGDAAVFCFGYCFHRSETITQLEIIVDDVRRRPAAWAMPRPDVLRMLGQEQSYRSGFWATVPARAGTHPGVIDLRVAARLGSGAEMVSRLGSIDVVGPERVPGPQRRDDRLDDDLIAICMATFEPDMRLFAAQVDSLRAQSDDRWICLISDDCSKPEHFEEIARVLEADRRFVLSRSEERLGFYRNFERALRMVPPEVQLVALSDQDDRWHPEKLEVLRGALGGAPLVYSDQRLVDADGRVLRNTLWRGRSNNYRNLASQLVANTITGAAMLMRREVAELALPFPDGPGFMFHDHWIGLVAMATGEIAFVDRPLYDYVQHGGAIFGDVTHGDRDSAAIAGDRGEGPSTKPWRAWFSRWRAAYFYGYLSRDVLARTALIRCSANLTAPKRRALQRYVNSPRSPLAFAWLALRPLRMVLGHTETLGSEADLARGILWRWLIVIRARRAKVPGRTNYDASLPDPATFDQRRLRRWRARI
jgi:glycosyltransferase involved in cell wall biosynthesis